MYALSFNIFLATVEVTRAAGLYTFLRLVPEQGHHRPQHVAELCHWCALEIPVIYLEIVASLVVAVCGYLTTLPVTQII